MKFLRILIAASLVALLAACSHSEPANKTAPATPATTPAAQAPAATAPATSSTATTAPATSSTTASAGAAAEAAPTKPTEGAKKG